MRLSDLDNLIALGGEREVVSLDAASAALDQMLAALRERGPLRRVLIVPPDYTRAHSWAGELTVLLWEKLRDADEVAILPALGTHKPMTDAQLAAMFPGVPRDAFHDHDWRNAIAPLGEVPPEFVAAQTEGKVSFPIPCGVNRLLIEGEWSAILSVGQVVPHEVAGIANHAKNIFVGAGGGDTIHKTHFVGAVYGMERMMGRADGPVRAIFREMARAHAAHLPIVYLLTVRDRGADGSLVTRALHAGAGDACFDRAAAVCRAVNINHLPRRLDTVVVWLDPDEYHSTWLGNKAIYRTRMALADGGRLIVLAPGVRMFGEDETIDALIRRFGYRGTPETLAAVEREPDLAANLSAAAHLIHGSSEGRFRVIYCPGPDGLTREEIESVGFEHGDLAAMLERYPVRDLPPGEHTLNGESIFFIDNPGLGLWSGEA